MRAIQKNRGGVASRDALKRRGEQGYCPSAFPLCQRPAKHYEAPATAFQEMYNRWYADFKRPLDGLELDCL
eukprot:12897606-Prorocentrum_lima.AAC.1